MCNRHGIIDFIKERLDDEIRQGNITGFTAKSISSQIDSCHAPSNDDWQALTSIACNGCQDKVYPCRRLRDMAENWKDHEEFDSRWRMI